MESLMRTFIFLEPSLFSCPNRARAFLFIDTDLLANACRASSAELHIYTHLGGFGHILSIESQHHQYLESAGRHSRPGFETTSNG
jgi:hypothetical protein